MLAFGNRNCSTKNEKFIQIQEDDRSDVKRRMNMYEKTVSCQQEIEVYIGNVEIAKTKTS